LSGSWRSGFQGTAFTAYAIRCLARDFPLARHGAGLNTLPPGRGLSKKVTIVQEEDIKLLRRIVAGGGRKYTAGNIDRSRYDRLVDLGWLTPFKTNISDVEYQVTEKGRAAAVANGHD
jgi:hypothetical protein